MGGQSSGEEDRGDLELNMGGQSSGEEDGGDLAVQL